MRADLRDLRRDSTIKTLENFRSKVLRELGKLKISWPQLDYRTPRGCLELRPSPPRIAPLPSTIKRECFLADSFAQTTGRSKTQDGNAERDGHRMGDSRLAGLHKALGRNGPPDPQG